MAESAEHEDGVLDLRVSDAERNAVVDILRTQTGAGRLTLGEFEDRLEEVFGARTRRDLEQALRELPVQPPGPVPGKVDDDDDFSVSEEDLRGRYHRRMRKQLADFVAPNFVCNMIWLLGDAGYWWPGWVLLGTGVGVFSAVVRGFDPDKERSELIEERRKQRMAEIEARHGKPETG